MVTPIVVGLILLAGVAGLAAVAELSRSAGGFGTRATSPVGALAPSERRGYLVDLAVLAVCALAIARVAGVW